MKDNELIEILKEFDEKRVEQLNDNARNLFNAIMDISNQRDRLLEEKQELIDYLKEQIDLQTEITKNSKIFRSTKYQIAISLRLLCQEILSKIEKSKYEN